MLTPKETPYLQGLNSYYLDIPKLIEHFQGEIGSGCLICKGINEELQLYFDQSGILRILRKQRGEKSQIVRDHQVALHALAAQNFQVAIYYLDENSIYFWAQMPQFNWGKEEINSVRLPLPALVDKLLQKNFSGFIDIELPKREDCAVLFFFNGQHKGGSYGWQRGGLNTARQNYDRLLETVSRDIATYKIGYFKKQVPAKEQIAEQNTRSQTVDYDLIMEQFVSLFSQVLRRRGIDDPIFLLQQKALDHVTRYPYLDPFKGLYHIDENGIFSYHGEAPKEKILRAIVDCTWMVAEDTNVSPLFLKALHEWTFRDSMAKIAPALPHMNG